MTNYFILKYKYLLSDIKEQNNDDFITNYYLKIIEKKNVLNELYYNLARIPTFEDIINYIKYKSDDKII